MTKENQTQSKPESAEIAKAAKLGAPFYRRGMGDPILCDNAQAEASPDEL